MLTALEACGLSKVFYEFEGRITDTPGIPKMWNKRIIQTIRPRRKRIEAVVDIDFTITRGEIFGILGPNGSGKSTLIRIISTLLLPDEGRVTVFGHDVVRDRLAVRRLINRVSVEAAFFKKLSAMENLSYAARLYGLDPKIAMHEAKAIMNRLGLKDSKIYTPLENLSRGMQQKVAVARALFTSPVLLLLDEPTTGLDPVSKRDVQNFIQEIRNNHDATIILTTHDMHEAEKLCHRIAVIDNGKFVAMDTPENLKKQASTNGNKCTMEDVFFAFTGKQVNENKEVVGDEG